MSALVLFDASLLLKARLWHTMAEVAEFTQVRDDTFLLVRVGILPVTDTLESTLARVDILLGYTLTEVVSESTLIRGDTFLVYTPV